MAVVVAAVLMGVATWMDRSAIGAVVALFVLVVPFERRFPRHRQRFLRPDLGTDLAYALSTPVLDVVSLVIALPIAVLSLTWVPGLALRPLVGVLPPAVVPIVGLVLFDLVLYWTHRFHHEVPLLWRFHAVHHSTEHLDWISGLRVHPLDGVLLAPAFVFLIAAGFSPEVSGALVLVQIVVGFSLHANVRWQLRPLHRIVATPDFHHWHHANERIAINHNYGGLLPLWDLLFGTYVMPSDRRPSVYGVSEPMPSTMWGQLRYPFRDAPRLRTMLRHPWRTQRSLSRLIRTEVVPGVIRSARRPTR